MQPLFRCLTAAVAMLWVAGLAVAEKKTEEKPQTKEKITSSGKFVGKLVSAENTTKNFTVSVEIVEIDQNKLAAHTAHDQKRRIEISLVRDLREKQKQLVNHLVDMEQRKRDIYKKSTKNIEMAGADDIKVRMLVLPINFDDKGKVKKYTKKELAQLKGPDKKLPGYMADFDALHKDQTVRVYLAKQGKKKSKAKDKDKDKEKKKNKKDKDDDKDFLDDRLPVVMVVILAEPPMKDK